MQTLNLFQDTKQIYFVIIPIFYTFTTNIEDTILF